MPTRKPIVIVTRKLPDVVETRMRELFSTTLNDTDEPMSQAQLVEAVKKAEVLVPTVTDRIDKSVIMQAGDQLNLIAIAHHLHPATPQLLTQRLLLAIHVVAH